MKFVSFSCKNKTSVGIVNEDCTKVIDIHQLSKGTLPNNMYEYLQKFESNNKVLNGFLKNFSQNDYMFDLEDVIINAPLPNPNSFRDAYAFRKHVEAGRKNRGLEMIPEYDMFPVFYFSNHNSICGSGNINLNKNLFKKLDFEFEVGVIVSKEGKNISVEEAHKYIAGLVVMNDWSERAVQIDEMKLNLGPAKGKDFATSIGPYLITLDELEQYTFLNEKGIHFDLNMTGYLNGKLITSDNLKNMTWTFSEIIHRASLECMLYPGDLIGSGTCSKGCLLEINLSNDKPYWLKPQDEIILKVEKLGVLVNTLCSDE